MKKSSLVEAAKLAKWLVEERGTKSSVAYIIAVRKYNLPGMRGREWVRKEYQKIKGKDDRQGELF